MHITIAAVGSRGDVQPYLALGLGLKKAGYQVQICADRLFEKLVTSTGLTFTPVSFTPVDMMQQNLSAIGGPLKLIGWLQRHFKTMARQIFTELEAATRGTDAILYSMLGFAGYHVAQKHGIPSLAVYNIPITPTHAFQNPSAPPAPAWMPFKRSYNWWSFRLANRAFSYLIMAVVNECRREILGLMPLAPRFFRDLDISRLPIVYGFSPNILPAPDDWGEWLKVSGQWFMDDEPDWQPPGDLLHFLDAGVPPIYVGFGSMVDKQIKRVTPIVLQALNRTGQRGILLGGWGGLGQADLPRSVFYIESVPHSWLFPRVSAVVHHGGAGTTATGLRYGKPTVVVPFFADQPFWGHRIYQLGAGPRPITFAKLNAEGLSKAIDQAINDPMMQQNARNLGEKMRVEDGTGKAVDYIQGYLER